MAGYESRAVPAHDLRGGDGAATASTSPTRAFRRCIRWTTCCRNWPTRACRWWRSTFPTCGTPSRKERDEFKAFGQERGLRVYDDAKRLDRDYPEQMAKVRERCGASEDGLLVLATWAGEPQGPSSRRDRLPGLRTIAAAAPPEVQRPSQAARPQEFPVPLGGRFPDVRVGRGRQPLDRRASSVHLGARRGPRPADRRPGALPRQVATTWC